MKRSYFGVPLWGWLAAGGLAAGFWWYRGKKQAAAAAQQTQQASQVQATGTSTLDPALVAYQAGEAAGVSTYSAGVTTGIGLVDSIMGMFPAGPTSAQAGQSAATISAQPVGGGTADVSLKKSYTPISRQAALADIQQGVPVYEQGSSALQFAQTYGGNPAGIDPNAYYAQNPTPQQINLASDLGYPLYAAA